MAKQEMQKLAKETAIYGVSSILGKFMNWLLVPLYTFVLQSSSEYGIVTNLYAWTAFLLVVLTYGMETGFFRFANKNKDQADKVYSTTLISVFSTSLLFSLCCVFFAQPIANAMGYEKHPEFIKILAIVVAMDAFGSIPFAYLRYKGRPAKFATLKLFMIFTNILFNIFFLLICPWIATKNSALIDWFYDPNYGVGYVFVSNFISTTLVSLALLPNVFVVKFNFDGALLKKMLRYSLPLLILGIAGIMNQTLDKIIFPFLFHDRLEADTQLGIYGACFKIAMVMMMFTQAFRYAYEPFIFAKHKDHNSKEAYADAMKYFVIFSFLIFLGITFYLDVFKLIIRNNYWEGLRVVPIVLFSYLFQGIFFNLSLWYKLLDKTMYGAWFSIIGAIITLSINIVFVPKYGYMAAAWAAFVCYFAMMILSYFFGQRHMPINYDLKTIGLYTTVTLILFGASFLIKTEYQILNYIYKTGLLTIFIVLIIKRDLPLSSIPVVKKFITQK